MEWILVIIPAVIVALLLLKQKQKGERGGTKRNTNSSAEKNIIPDEKITSNKDYSQSYQRKYLLTKNEYREYTKLRQYTSEKDLLICPKVRMLDIIEPRKGEKDYKSLFYKVQAKHVDFVICDKDLRIKAILELDDGSHDTPDRKERDNFVDQILSSVGYKVIHVRSITESTLEGLGESKEEDSQQ